MGGFSLRGGGSDDIEAGYDFSKTGLTTITANSTTNTLGAFVELLSAANNTRPSNRITVQCVPNVATGQGEVFVNIALGGAGSEEIILPNLFVAMSPSNTTVQVYVFDFPIDIPAGVRISVAIQSSVSSGQFDVGIILSRGTLSQDSGLSIVDSIGAVVANTDGVLVATSGTINIFGAWVEITPSLAESIQGFIVSMVKLGGSWSLMEITYQVGVGSAGNEEIIFSGQQTQISNNEDGSGIVSTFRSVGIAKGERIAIRAQATSTNTDKDFDYIIYGVR